MNNKLKVLKHIKGKDCSLLPLLNDDSLHAIGEFLYNVIRQRLPLSENQTKKTKKF